MSTCMTTPILAWPIKNCLLWACHVYARWVPVHIHDMESLSPSILEELQAHGHWVAQKTHHHFSAIPTDQAHEQNNALVKCSGGAVGFTENPSSFWKWMLAGPEHSVQNNSQTSVNFRPFHKNDRSYCNMVCLTVWPIIYWTRWPAVWPWALGCQSTVRRTIKDYMIKSTIVTT